MDATSLNQVARRDRYPLAAYQFVRRGLEFTVNRIHGEIDEVETLDPRTVHSRHVSGHELCLGLRDYAQEQYGLLARTVLSKWGIRSCEDFGRIVFNMVEAGVMHKTDDDRFEDFVGVFDFHEAFTCPAGELAH